ncbi:MAG: NAD-dependent epimerase/dehydratase family protein [Bacteroidota bacterium]
MKILITGASGFVGGYVLTELLKHPNISIVIASKNLKKNTYSDERIEEKEFDLNFVDKYGNLMTYFNKPDMLIHLAWEGLPNYNQPIHEEQLIHHSQFIKNLVHNKIQKVVVTGTCLEYGLKEGCLTETMIAKPIIPYAISKAKLYENISALQKEYNFKFNWIRLFYMMGKRKNSKSILSQLENAIEQDHKVFNMSKGDQQRDYLPVEKIAEYIVKITLQKNIEGIVNCCSGKPITILKLVQDYLITRNATIKLNLGYYPYPDYEPFIFFGDVQKLNLALSN